MSKFKMLFLLILSLSIFSFSFEVAEAASKSDNSKSIKHISNSGDPSISFTYYVDYKETYTEPSSGRYRISHREAYNDVSIYISTTTKNSFTRYFQNGSQIYETPYFTAYYPSIVYPSGHSVWNLHTTNTNDITRNTKSTNRSSFTTDCQWTNPCIFKQDTSLNY